MKNKENWKPKRFTKDAKGRIIGTHNHKIIGHSYEPMIKKYATGILADIGCGDVPYYHFYKDLVEDNICIDWENSSLELSFLDHHADLNKPLTFLESNSFDTVLSTDVLEHIHEPALLFSEMTRILKSNGHLILAVPFLYWIHDNPHDYHRYTHFMLREFCKKNNLEVVELEAYGGLPEIIFDLIYKGYGYFNLPLKSFFYPCFNFLGRFMSKRGFVKRMSINSRPTFPMGYILVARKNNKVVNKT
jgi:SAM-dependent methyltransferase